jgi:hypothetical protein
MNRFMRAASLVVTDRRWAATLSAAALGFGLFIGVAIGPGAAGSLATGAQQVIEVPGLLADTEGGDGGGEGRRDSVASTEPSSAASGEEEEALPEAFPSSIPLAPESSEPPPAEEAEPPPTEPAAAEEEEEPEAETLKGVVVQANPAAGSYALAISGGELVAVHASKLPPVGAKLSAPLGQLENGTFAEEGDREQQGKTARATFRGIVSFADPDPVQPAYTVSGRGASLLVHVPLDPTGAAPLLPPLGSYVTVTAGIESPEPPAEAGPATTLVQRQIEVEPGEPSTYLEVAGTVSTVLPETAQLLLSADGSRESGKDLTLAVPPAIDTTKLEVGDSYLATVTIEEDGMLTLSGIASDEHMKGADNPASAQGDLKRKGASASRPVTRRPRRFPTPPPPTR